MSTSPAIVTVAITGSQPQKADNPAVPITPEEQIESTHAAYEAGAALVHVHARTNDGRPSSDPALFGRFLGGVRRYCPEMIVQFSTGGRGRGANERGSAIPLKPEMASLATGSVNFATSVYENDPALIDELAQAMIEYDVKPEVEVFDLAMLYNARRLADRGLLKEPAHVQFVLGIPGALPARRKVLEFLVDELGEVMPGATWTAAGIGRHQLTVNHWAAELGGHLRTGLEDNIRASKDRLADSNAELVCLAVDVLESYGRRPATAAEARKILGLPAATMTA
ncbi:3-keto-5-aminohexanoate cleavage protein [Ferruginivarius sediminum]|uniref:3-keto-5-aminohexanoate cleavage protein n=1 Tax=Ferruginivarius sediminum TaxID=2661937 RepID=A0A369TF48_9PROT|nr:3-keto-5-aminohexanoate cleavage protein [Ferruginivarius sediminum]RDD61536.1 3-keto-5-aminohexanoate cleavage protein [Ferruginivarius sediminum]